MRAWPRLAAPGVAFVALAAAAALFRVATYDVWWHLAAGRWILAHRAVPRADPFSYTAAGREWIDHEWLFQVLVYTVERLAGPAGLVVGKAALVAATAAVVYRFVVRESGLAPAAAALLLVPFLLAGRYRFVVRPELFTVLFAALLLAALLRRRERPATWRELWWIPPTFALWANLHGGVIAGVVLLGAFTVGRFAEALLGERGDGEEISPRTAAVLLAVSVLAGLLNTFGWRVYAVPFQLTALIADGPFRNLEWMPPRWPTYWLYFVVAAATAAIAVAAVATRRRRVSLAALLPLAFLLLVSLRYVRNLALFGLLAPILLVALVRRGAAPVGAGRFAALRPRLATTLLVLLAASFLVTGAGFAPGLGVDAARLPVGAVDFVDAVRPPGRMLNAYAFGGYAAWRLYPDYRTFIDGRNEVFVDLRERLALAVVDSREWRALLADHDIAWTLLEYIDGGVEVREMGPGGGPPRVVRRPFAVTYFPPEEWALVYWDDTAMVHVRREPATAALVARYESAVQPEDPAHLRDLLRTGRADALAVTTELQARAAAGQRRARRLLAALGVP